MFTVKIIRNTYGTESMLLADDVRYALNEVTLDGSAIALEPGDIAFVMNPAGATISKYSYRGKHRTASADAGTASVDTGTGVTGNSKSK